MGLRSVSSLFHREPEPEPEDDEEERGDIADWTKTELGCSACNEKLHFTEEVFHLGMAKAFNNGHDVVTMPVLCEGGEFEGDFYYDPLFFEFSCWENLVESLREMVEDAPPTVHKDALLSCSYCGCSICEWEIFGTAYLGELRVSRRMPNGDTTSTFTPLSEDPYIICIGCLVLLNEHECDLWEDDIAQIGECQECTHIRCWRHHTCSCPCHEERSEDAQETEGTHYGYR